MIRWGRRVALSSAVASLVCFAVGASAGAVAPTRVAGSPGSAAASAFGVADASDVPPDDLTEVTATAPALFDPDTSTWTVDGASAALQFGQPGDLPAVVDPGGGAVAQIGVFRPSTGTWYNTQTGTTTGIQWGQAGDVPVASHYAGIGNATTIAVYRPDTKAFMSGRWFIKGAPSFGFGAAGDIPVPGSYYGTAADDWATHAAVFRPSTGQWFVRDYGTVHHADIHYGENGDIPVPGDYDGNGTTDIAVYRPSTGTWFIRGQAAVHYGTSGDIPVTGDFTGAGHVDIAVYRPSANRWFVRGVPSFTFGDSGDTPVEAAPYHG